MNRIEKAANRKIELNKKGLWSNKNYFNMSINIDKLAVIIGELKKDIKDAEELQSFEYLEHKDSIIQVNKIVLKEMVKLIREYATEYNKEDLYN